ncbi:MAG: hypothetical protein QM686_06605 [Herbaspirillum sp.]
MITSSADMLETPAETALHQMPSDVTRADSIAQQNASAAAAAGWMRPRTMCTVVQKGMDELTGKPGVMHKKPEFPPWKHRSVCEDFGRSGDHDV